MTAILETRDLSKRFGGVAAVDEVNFSLNDGELRCLIGPNGAGKSTFFKMLCGQLKPSEGQVLFRGNDITGAEPHGIARAGMGIKTQVPSVYDGLSLRENIMLSAWRTRTKRDALAIVEDLLMKIRLADQADRLVGHLAHGQRQWVELAMVLAQDPVLVLLDEPTAGMTLDEVESTAALIRDINQTYSIIVVEHDMQFIRMIAETVTVFHQGKILAEDQVDNIMRNPAVRDVYLGKQADRGA
jgi:branched-chain amino acid transport system ATP-binding protein